MKPQLMAVPSTTPKPPYSPDVIVGSFHLAIDFMRFMQSDTWLRTSDSLKPWVVWIWHVSWVQRPPGSLPADDEDIALRIGMPLETFKAHRDTLMRKWKPHSDGRLYHPVLTEIIQKMLDGRQKDRDRKRQVPDKPKDEPDLFPPDSNGIQQPPADSNVVRGNPSKGKVSEVKEGKVSSSSAISSREQTTSDLQKKAKGNNGTLVAEATEVLLFLNRITGHYYRPEPNTLKPIVARLKDGATVSDCRAVIVRKNREWQSDEKMAKFLRPSTLFGAEKFAQYIGEVPPEKPDV